VRKMVNKKKKGVSRKTQIGKTGRPRVEGDLKKKIMREVSCALEKN